jgi:hypothetical protein
MFSGWMAKWNGIQSVNNENHCFLSIKLGNWKDQVSATKISGLNPRTHCNLLPYIMRSCPIKTVLYNRFLRFYNKVNCNKKSYIKLAGVLSLDGSRTSVSNTTSCVAYELDIPRGVVPLAILMPVGESNEGLRQCGSAIRDSKRCCASCYSYACGWIQRRIVAMWFCHKRFYYFQR